MFVLIEFWLIYANSKWVVYIHVWMIIKQNDNINYFSDLDEKKKKEMAKSGLIIEFCELTFRWLNSIVVGCCKGLFFDKCVRNVDYYCYYPFDGGYYWSDFDVPLRAAD